MVFSSAVFLLIFLPITLAVYYIIPRKFKNLVLLIASLVFYAWGEPIYILIMLFSTVFDYGNGLLLERFEKSGKNSLRKLILVLSVVVNLGLLCFFKYTDFAIKTVNSLTGMGLQLMHIALPIGISFYTFQTLSYTIDVYRRKVKAQHSVIRFGMYICMFPQLIAGPIVRYADIENQLNNRTIDVNKISSGIFRFTLGLAKKVVIANQLGAVWDEIYAGGGNISTLSAFTGAAAFMLQIYFDFSGYSDMAIGLGRMLGFDLLENFNYPYESASITEFWRRWHISLGTWFKEYVYIPLGGNRKGLARQIINLFVVWFLTGLWHGAGWNFVLWGLYFFVLLVIEKLGLLKLLNKIPKIFARIYTLLAVMISWILFASDDINTAFSFIVSLFGKNDFADAQGIYCLKSNFLLLIIGAVFSTGIVKKIYTVLKHKCKKTKPLFIAKAVICIAIYALCLAMVINSSYNPFLYFRF